MNQVGTCKLDSVYRDVLNHCHVMRCSDGHKLLYGDGFFDIKPEKGDSLIKKKGSLEFTFIRHDSIYVQRFKCNQDRVEILKKGKTDVEH